MNHRAGEISSWPRFHLLVTNRPFIVPIQLYSLFLRKQRAIPRNSYVSRGDFPPLFTQSTYRYAYPIFCVVMFFFVKFDESKTSLPAFCSIISILTWQLTPDFSLKTSWGLRGNNLFLVSPCMVQFHYAGNEFNLVNVASTPLNSEWRHVRVVKLSCKVFYYLALERRLQLY